MQTAEPLNIRQAKATAQVEPQKQAAQAADPAPSFRQSLDKAQKQAAGKAQGSQASGEEAPLSLEIVGALEEEARPILAMAALPPEEGKIIEDLLPLGQMDEEQPGEDVPVENEAQMAILAALLLQPAKEEEASPPTEMAQAMPDLVELPSAKSAANTVADPAAKAQPLVPQEGERELPRMEEPQAVSATPEQENTLFGEDPKPPAMRAVAAAGQPRERDMSRAQPEPHARQENVAFTPQAAMHPQADLSGPGGEPLPPAEAGPILMDSLFEQVQSAVNTGKEELLVQLKPESLGGLVIHLSMTENGLKAQVRTSSENIQHLVTGQIAQLEEALRARDIPVVQMDVIYDQSASNSFLGQQRQAWQESSGGWGRGSYGIQGTEETAGLYEAALGAAEEDLGVNGVEYTA